MAKEKAILISANLKGKFGPEHRDVGNVLVHVSHIEKEGAVLWGVSKSGQGSRDSFSHPEIRKGYFYNVADKAVTHAFDVEYISAVDQIPEKRSINRYLIESRKATWKKSRRDEFYWMKISGIYRLKIDHPFTDFRKYNDQKPLRICRNYSIVVDPHFKHHDAKVTRREIMSDYIGDLLILGKVTEKNIEDLFSFRLADRLSLVERQGFFRKAGLLDLLYKNRLGKYTLYELKKGIAKLSVLDQIKRYMKASIKKHKISPQDITGVILAKSIDPELYRALSTESRIQAKTYSF